MKGLLSKIPFLAVGATAIAATSLVARNADAYCRTVAANAPPGYDPALTGCFAPAGAFDLYWKNLCVGYSLQKNASPLRQITLEQATQVATDAFAKWGGVSCAAGGAPSIKAVDLGPVQCAMVQYSSTQPNQHVIIFHDDPWLYNDASNTLGLTTLTYDTTDGEIFDADMEINTHDYDLVASGAVPDGAYDLASVITHEAGHFLGLAHSADNNAVMYAHYQAGHSVLTVDDEDGICSVYPPGGTRVTSAGPLNGDACDPTPRHGFSSTCASANGGAGDAGASGGGGSPVPAAAHSGCSVGGVAAVGAAGQGGFGLLVLGFLAWFRREVRRRSRVGAHRLTAACALALVVGTASSAATRDARASVSVAVLFEELVRDSSAVATVTPIERYSAWENGRIYSYARVNVDALIAGALPRQVWIRTMGGVVGTIGQVVEGEPSFAVGRQSLVFLAERSGAFGVIARGQGQFAVVTRDGDVPRLASASGAGTLVSPTAGSVAQIRNAGVIPRFARDVLPGRPLLDAVRDIGAAWGRMHTK